MILMSSFVLAATLSISPGTLELNGKANEDICGNLILKYSSSGNVEGTDLWASGGTEKILNLYDLKAEELGITINYPTQVYLQINVNKEIEVCVTAQNEGIFQGALYFVPIYASGNQAPGVGTWLSVNIQGGSDIPEPEPDTDSDGDGVDNDADVCPDTPSGETVNSEGCSCSQLVIGDGNPCTDDSCNNGIVTHTNNNAQCGYARNCPVDGCSGTNWLDYPNDGHDYCSVGSCHIYSCAAISSTPDADCNADDDADNDGVIDYSDSCPDTPAGETANSEGCSCSQLVIDDGNVCTDESCNNGIVTHTNNNAQCGYARDCQNDGCSGKNWIDYPDDGNDYCSAGECNVYSCASISSRRQSECNDDDDDKSSSSSNEESDGNTYLMATVAADPLSDCTENWKCGSWSECINKKQTRACEDKNKCNTIKNKPAESRACIIQNLPTGEVIANLKTGKPSSVSVGIFIIFSIVISGLLVYLLIVSLIVHTKKK